MTPPSADNAAEVDLERVKAELAQGQSEQDAIIASAKAELDNELTEESADAALDRALVTAFHAKLMEVAAGSIERARDGATFIQTAAAALTAVYVSLLGLVYSVTGKSLPVRALYSPSFLGLAVALALAYLSFLRKIDGVPTYRPAATAAETALARTANFIDWVGAGVLARSYALRAAVIAFAVGVAFIPAAFIGPAVTSTAGAAPTPPVAPRSVPDALAKDAQRLFSEQVSAYEEALKQYDEATKAAAGATPAKCHWPRLARSCGWETQAGIERSTLQLAILGLLLVFAGAYVGGTKAWAAARRKLA